MTSQVHGQQGDRHHPHGGEAGGQHQQGGGAAARERPGGGGGGEARQLRQAQSGHRVRGGAGRDLPGDRPAVPRCQGVSGQEGGGGGGGGGGQAGAGHCIRQGGPTATCSVQQLQSGDSRQSEGGEREGERKRERKGEHPVIGVASSCCLLPSLYFYTKRK